MPILVMHLMQGRTTDQKKRAAAAVTEALVNSLGVKPESVRILISELQPDGFYVAGEAPMAPDPAPRQGAETPAVETLA